MKTITTLLAAALALASTAHDVRAASEGDMAPADKAANQLYWQGQAALKKSDWSTALKRFTELERLLREKEPQSADAALYWEAYALTQARRTTEAKTTLDRLHREFPNSRWSKDADALVQQGSPATVKSVGNGGDEELAEVALEGLMSAPPERALPLLKKVMCTTVSRTNGCFRNLRAQTRKSSARSRCSKPITRCSTLRPTYSTRLCAPIPSRKPGRRPMTARRVRRNNSIARCAGTSPTKRTS